MTTVKTSDLFKTPPGIKTGVPAIDEREAAEAKALKQIKKRFAEQQLRAIYLEDCREEERAEAETVERIPYPEAGSSQEAMEKSMNEQGNLREKLIGQYRRAVGRRHGLSLVHLDAIKYEGLRNNWPME